MNRVMFNRDIKNERVLARYLDLYFYPDLIYIIFRG